MKQEHTIIQLILISSLILLKCNAAELPSSLTLNINLPAITQSQSAHAQAQPTTQFECATTNQPLTSLHHEHTDTHTITATSQAELTNTLTISAMISTVQQTVNTLKQKMQHITTTAQSFANIHIYKIILLCVVGAYMGTVCRLWYDNHYLHDSKRWGNWCSNNDRLPDHQEITGHLLEEIQTRYIINYDPTNFIMPLIYFLQAIEQEEKIIQRYIWYTYYLDKPFIRRIFPTVHTKKAVDLLAHTHLVHALCTKWIAAQNIAHYTSIDALV